MIFIIYLHLLQVINHLKKQLVWLYQVYSSWYLFIELIFLIWLHSLHVKNHSMIQLVLLYQVYSYLSLLLIDVPFTKGKYNIESSCISPFYSLRRDMTHSDNSREVLYLIIHSFTKTISCYCFYVKRRWSIYSKTSKSYSSSVWCSRFLTNWTL